MNCTKNMYKEKNAVGSGNAEEAPHLAERYGVSSAVGNTKHNKTQHPPKDARLFSEVEGGSVHRPLTNQKKVVDIDETERYRKTHYGLCRYDVEEVEKKLKYQKSFLDYSFLYDRINQRHIPLSHIII